MMPPTMRRTTCTASAGRAAPRTLAMPTRCSCLGATTRRLQTSLPSWRRRSRRCRRTCSTSPARAAAAAVAAGEVETTVGRKTTLGVRRRTNGGRRMTPRMARTSKQRMSGGRRTTGRSPTGRTTGSRPTRRMTGRRRRSGRRTTPGRRQTTTGRKTSRHRQSKSRGLRSLKGHCRGCRRTSLAAFSACWASGRPPTTMTTCRRRSERIWMVTRKMVPTWRPLCCLARVSS
mmetsp:Transcript_59181/g.137812  ORF Transcript_59181/g.137812 Transcript_59181/m.137812 type:complete len:231 (+) Transcript_59181:80-772(+)